MKPSVGQALARGPQILAAVAILVIGWLVVLEGVMALREMALTNENTTIAFALVLGAIAFAAAIAFGIGGRDLAADSLKRGKEQLESGA